MDWSRILVFGAHPDDEIIGPGGTLARFAREGAYIVVVTMTAGETGYASADLRDKVAQLRAEEARQADEILGIRERVNLGLPTQGVVNTRDVYQECVRLIRLYRPTVIFTHYKHDKHRDHRATYEIVDEARYKAQENVLADKGEPWYTPHLLFYEIFELFLFPSVVVDITDTFHLKRQAMEAQVSQLDVLPGILNFMEGLARVRGFSRGTTYAEAFLLSNTMPVRV